MRHDGSAVTGEPLPRAQVRAYEAALQHVTVDPPAAGRPRLDRSFANAARRCALVQPAFRVIADGESYPELATTARENGAFGNQMESEANAGATWSIRLRRYGPVGSGTDGAVPAPHACYGKPGRGRSATRDEAEGSDGTRSSEEKE